MLLLAETGLYRDALASLGAPARNHRASALGLHTRAKSVRLRAAATVGLECTLRHYETALLTGNKFIGENVKYIGFPARPATWAPGRKALPNGSASRCYILPVSGLGGQAGVDGILHRGRSNEIFFSQ
jgi:hypothetical protein